MSKEIPTIITNQIEREILANNEIRQIIEDCFGQRDNSKKYLVTIQGCSSSGKSTIADNIRDILARIGVEVYMLSLDSFYKTYTDVKEYDFDNPGAFDWEKIDEVLGALSKDDEFIPTYQYSFETWICDGPIYIKNKKPSVIIMEGIYAFNSINDYKFNIGEFDPLQSKKVIENEFVKNETKFDFKILKVKLSMCKSKSLAVRIERDSKQRNKPKEASLLQFENQVWPATIKWVNNPIFNEDIAIVHGSFNEEKVVALIKELAKYFTGKTVNVDGIMCEKNLKHCFSVSCSGECQSNLEK